MTCFQSVPCSLSTMDTSLKIGNPKEIFDKETYLRIFLLFCLNLLILKFLEGHKKRILMDPKYIKTPHRYIFFAQQMNVTIFCKANNKSISFIQNTLKLFANEAGLKILWHKCEAFFSKNTPKSKIREIYNQLQISPANVREKYLGLPLITQKITKESFYDIILNTQSKISNWYDKLLSYARRSTLVNYVLHTLSQCTMNTHKRPEIMINKINTLSKKILCNALEN